MNTDIIRNGRRPRFFLTIALIVLIGVSFNVYADDEEGSTGTFSIDVGAYYVSPIGDYQNLDIEALIFDSRTLLNLRLGFDIEFAFDVTDWFGIATEVGLYGMFYTYDSVDNYFVLEVPIRLGPRFSFGIGHIQPFLGYVPVYTNETGELSHYVESGATLKLGPVSATAAYIIDVQDVDIRDINISDHFTDDGLLKVGLALEIIETEF